MISFSGLSAGSLFDNLHLSLEPNRLVCLTGPNGSGKTTLLHLLHRQAIGKHLDCRVLLQSAAVDHCSAGEGRSEEIEELFRSSSDLLLLDEPTNHLDSLALSRLLGLIHRFQGALLVVSHDRRLLYEADRIMHLEAGSLEVYGGGFALYQEQRRLEEAARYREAERLRRRADELQGRLRSSVARQQARRRHAETLNRTQKNPKSLVNRQRNRADRTEARIETHHKRLVRQAEEAAHRARDRRLSEGRPLDLRPRSEALASKPLMTVHRLQLQRGIADRLSFTIRSDSRTGIVGPCGAGKSTLVEALLFGSHMASGEVLGRPRRPLLLDQELSLLALPGRTVASVFADYCKEENNRTILAAAGFTGKIQDREVISLSGGERMRLALAVAFAGDFDLLVLDEPTNNLDQRGREELEQALLSWRAALIVVSHDREFLETIDIREYVSLDRSQG